MLYQNSNWSRVCLPGTIEAHLWKLIWKLLCPIEGAMEFEVPTGAVEVLLMPFSHPGVVDCHPGVQEGDHGEAKHFLETLVAHPGAAEAHTF